MAPIVETPASAAPSLWRGRWADEADTQAFAARLAACPSLTNATLALQGELGAGKTTFVRHLLRALGVRGRIKSPTYAVVEPYRVEAGSLALAGAPLAVWHFDFYRFTDPREWEDAGFRELFASPGLKLVEWPQRAAGLVSVIDAELMIEPDDTMSSSPGDDLAGVQADAPRRVTFHALTPTGRQLLAALPL